MNHLPLRRPAVAAYGLFCLSVLCACLLATIRRSVADSQQKEAATAAPEKAAGGGKLDPARVMGAKACVKCHKSEYARWMKTVHYSNAERLKTAAAVKYAKAMGIAEADIAKNSLCTTCHATTQKQESGSVVAISGVSCESCHGAAGGDPGWLNRHAVYGPEGTKRNNETPGHRKARLEFCAKQGKVGPRNLYGLAKKCFGCHIVGNEKLLDASHKPGSATFEFASWTNGEVRHNFHIDQTKNAAASSLWLNPVGKQAGQKRSAANRRRVMYVVGMLVELETVLRDRAKATKAGALTTALGGRIGALAGKLPALAAVAPAQEVKDVAALVPPLLGRAFVVKEGDDKFFTEQADKVAKAARSFLANHDGSKFPALDGMIPGKHYSENYKGPKD